LTVTSEDWATVERIREQALAIRQLKSASNEYVPARLAAEGDTSKVSIRLKGDLPDHFEGERWSFRVKMKGDNEVFELERFSIQDPKTRNNLFEWLFHRALQQEDLFYLDYHFVDVTVNGEEKGIYALEEHISKATANKMVRPNSVIIRFNEDGFWENYWEQKDNPEHDNRTYLTAPIEAYQAKRLKKSPELKQYFHRASRLLDGFRKGTTAASDAFDVEQTARFLAVLDLFGAWHANRWHNKRWYYNPETDKLEPVGFDANGRKLNVLAIHDTRLNATHRNTLFQDPALLQAYTRELERIAQPEYLAQFFEAIDRDYQCQCGVFLANFLDWDIPRYREVLERNQRVIAKSLPDLQQRGA
ncbi:MAG: CotH kinase family protein, partial [Bacteroidota bacterium]